MLPHLEDRVDGMCIKSDAKVPSSSKKPCYGCNLGKAKKTHFHRNATRAKKVGKLHLDYKSSKTPSLYNGNTGYFIMWDEGSGTTCAIPTNNKRGDTQLEAFKIFEAELERNGHKVYEIVCDGGGEYINTTTLNYWKLEKQYKLGYSAPDTPEHNSRAERRILTLDNKMNAMLQHFQLGDCYWEQCLLLVVHIENRVISTHYHIPPMEKLTGKRVSVAHLTMPFGTMVYCLKRDRLKSESRKAHPGLYMGVPADQPKGILVHVPALGRLVVVSHYTIDRSVRTKADRMSIDWYGLHNYDGHLPEDDEVAVDVDTINASLPSPSLGTSIRRRVASAPNPPIPLRSFGTIEEAMMEDDGTAGAMGGMSPPPTSSSDPVLKDGGLTWSQQVGGYGDHFQVPAPTEGYNLRHRSESNVSMHAPLHSACKGHVSLMAHWENDDPFKDA